MLKRYDIMVGKSVIWITSRIKRCLLVSQGVGGMLFLGLNSKMLHVALRIHTDRFLRFAVSVCIVTHFLMLISVMICH